MTRAFTSKAQLKAAIDKLPKHQVGRIIPSAPHILVAELKRKPVHRRERFFLDDYASLFDCHAAARQWLKSQAETLPPAGRRRDPQRNKSDALPNGVGLFRIAQRDSCGVPLWWCWVVQAYWYDEHGPHMKTFRIGDTQFADAALVDRVVQLAIAFRRAWEYAADNHQSFDIAAWEDWRALMSPVDRRALERLADPEANSTTRSVTTYRDKNVTNAADESFAIR